MWGKWGVGGLHRLNNLSFSIFSSAGVFCTQTDGRGREHRRVSPAASRHDTWQEFHLTASAQVAEVREVREQQARQWTEHQDATGTSRTKPAFEGVQSSTIHYFLCWEHLWIFILFLFFLRDAICNKPHFFYLTFRQNNGVTTQFLLFLFLTVLLCS